MHLAVFIILGIVLILFEISIPSAVILAILAPAPIAIPKLLLASTGLSFIPSPIKITFSFVFFNSSITTNLSFGNKLAFISSTFNSFPITSAFFKLSPVNIIIFLIPISFKFFTISTLSFLISSVNITYPAISLSILKQIAFSGISLFIPISYCSNNFLFPNSISLPSIFPYSPYPAISL